MMKLVLSAKLVKKSPQEFPLHVNMSDNDVSSSTWIQASIPLMKNLQQNQSRIGEGTNNHTTIGFNLNLLPTPRRSYVNSSENSWKFYYNRRPQIKIFSKSKDIVY